MMQLLNEIITSASGNDEQITVTLRKCLILAFKLKNDALKVWVAHELNGYGDDDLLPSYRKALGNSKGFFLGRYSSFLNDQPIPASRLDEEHRHWASEIELRQPIAAYEGANLDSKPVMPWPAELVVRYQNAFFQDNYILNRAWLEISPSMLTGLIDVVRTRALTLALQIQEELPEGTTEDQAIKELLPERVQQIINVTIMGGGTSVIGSVGNLQSISVTARDFDSLKSELTKLGVSQEQIDELKLDLETDRAELPTGNASQPLGKATLGWIAKTAASVGKVGLKITANVAEEIFKRALLQYLGITP
jgi:AbiTii